MYELVVVVRHSINQHHSIIRWIDVVPASNPRKSRTRHGLNFEHSFIVIHVTLLHDMFAECVEHSVIVIHVTLLHDMFTECFA